MQQHDSNLRPSVRKFETGDIPGTAAADTTVSPPTSQHRAAVKPSPPSSCGWRAGLPHPSPLPPIPETGGTYIRKTFPDGLPPMYGGYPQPLAAPMYGGCMRLLRGS